MDPMLKLFLVLLLGAGLTLVVVYVFIFVCFYSFREKRLLLALQGTALTLRNVQKQITTLADKPWICTTALLVAINYALCRVEMIVSTRWVSDPGAAVGTKVKEITFHLTAHGAKLAHEARVNDASEWMLN
jgi:hypothetical protein